MKPFKERTSNALKGLPRKASAVAIDVLDLGKRRGNLSVFVALAMVFSMFAVVVALVQVTSTETLNEMQNT